MFKQKINNRIKKYEGYLLKRKVHFQRSQLGPNKEEIYMEGLMSNVELAIPMSQIIILLIISIGFVLFGNFKSALVANFIFIFYWMSQNNKSSFQNISFNNVVHLAGNYTLITSTILFGIALLIIYEIFE